MNKDELAQWLADYLRPRYQVFDAEQRVVEGIRLTDLGDMAIALLDAMKPDVHHLAGPCWCICHDEAPVPDEAESTPLTPPDVLVRPKGPVWMRVVIRETCPVCQGQSKPSKCGTCGGFGTIESAMPFDKLMDLYWTGVKDEVVEQVKKGIL